MTTQPPNPDQAALTDLFLFNRGNQKFLVDSSQPLVVRDEQIWLTTMLLLLPVLLGSILEAEWLSSMLYVGLTLILLVLWARATRHHRRLRNEGQVLRGQVIQSKKRGWISARWIWLRYSLITPDGRDHQLTEVVVDPNARAVFEPRRLIRALPEPGTRITVLYVNDKLHMVL
jgi:hypothetical protein